MSETALSQTPSLDRAKLGKLIRRRPRVGTGSALIMSLLFALVASLLVNAESVLFNSGAIGFEEGKPAPVTLRVSQFSGFRDERVALEGGPVVVVRGQMVDAETAALARSIIAHQPSGLPAIGAFMAAFFLFALLYTTQLRRSHRGRLLRTQAVTLLLLVGGAAAFKIALLVSPMSVFLVPVAGAAIVATVAVDVSVGLATGLIVSVLCGLMVPFDMGVLAILGVQSATAVLMVGHEKRRKNRHIILAGLVSAVAAVLGYVVLHYLATLESPLYDMKDPLRSTVVAAGAGGLLSAFAAILALPLYQFLLGDITRNRLVELEDLSNPLLKQIARDSPGTWQHSLAMANMAEIATNAIGGNGRLVRVGAYYHDLGKSLQPKYFIENLEAGESSPHDQLPPEVSCDAIFAHVTEGTRVGREAGLPERIVDFMHMHHGDGLLQYFWTKCQESGNPKGLTMDDFRYPGIPPQSRETAILAIVDAVEAASRTLKSTDDASVSKLVQRIVYGKLHLGQLDESGLSMSDLRKISKSLCESIKHAHHGRIEYPWQRQEREEAARKAAEAAAAGKPGQDAARSAVVQAEMAPTTTQRIIQEPRLDSLDVPRPYWRDPRHQQAASAARAGADASPAAPVAAAAVSASAIEVEISPAAGTSSPAVAVGVDPDDARPPAESVVEVATTEPVGPSAGDPPWASAMRASKNVPVPSRIEPQLTPSVPILLTKKKQPKMAEAAPAPEPEPAAAAEYEGEVEYAAEVEYEVEAAAEVEVEVEAEPEPVAPPPPPAPPAKPDFNATSPLAALPAGVVERANEVAEAFGRARKPVGTALLSSAPKLPPAPVRRPPGEAAARVLERAKAEVAPDGSFAEEPTSVAESLSASASHRQPPPPPGSRERNKGETIELMKEHRAATAPVEEAEIEDEEQLVPGTLVLGPPPATRPKKKRS